MTGDTVIRAEGLSKRYLVGHRTSRDSYQSLRETLVRQSGKSIRKTIDLLRGRQIVEGDETEEFWALKDVSFEVKRGEVVGVIGRNGAGKSTLLKILSRIVEPTGGNVTVRGRIASLLEVGTGFHPELTGRENVFLNGAILGMSRAEIRRKFDEIVAFAEVEKFLDTPVKRYSSGMYVRLAFAVAAHLDPEILVVDEVLAVGDAEFQKKCLGKMSEVASVGRTVLFVSHNMAAVERLCRTAILLQNGKIATRGTVLEAVQAYQSCAGPSALLHELGAVQNRSGRGTMRFKSVEIWGESKGQAPVTNGELNILIALSGDAMRPRASRVGIGVSSAFGARLIICSTEMTMARSPEIGGKTQLLCRIPGLPLTKGRYLLTLFIEQDRVIEDWIQDACSFDVDDGDFFGYGRNAPSGWDGQLVLVPHAWQTLEQHAKAVGESASSSYR